MTKRLPKEAWMQTVEYLVNQGFDVSITYERVDGEATDFVIIKTTNSYPGGILDQTAKILGREANEKPISHW